MSLFENGPPSHSPNSVRVEKMEKKDDYFIQNKHYFQRGKVKEIFKTPN